MDRTQIAGFTKNQFAQFSEAQRMSGLGDNISYLV